MLHFAIGKPMAHHGKFSVKRTARSTLANYGKLSRAKHRGKKRSPASHKRMANNGIFTFPGVKASHGLPRFFSSLIKKNGTSATFCQKIGKTTINCGLTVLYPFRRKRQKCCVLPMTIFRRPVFLGPQGPWP